MLGRAVVVTVEGPAGKLIPIVEWVDGLGNGELPIMPVVGE